VKPTLPKRMAARKRWRPPGKVWPRRTKKSGRTMASVKSKRSRFERALA